MNILFYLDPWSASGELDAQFNIIDTFFRNIGVLLKQSGHHIELMCNRHIKDLLLSRRAFIRGVSVASPEIPAPMLSSGVRYTADAIKRLSQKEKIKWKENVQAALIQLPDMVLCWGEFDPVLPFLFPDAVILRISDGVFQFAPLPRLLHIEPLDGLSDDSGDYLKQIEASVVSDDIEFSRSVRAHYFDRIMTALTPLTREELDPYHCFSSLYLLSLPTQEALHTHGGEDIDSPMAYLTTVLSGVPKDVGVVVVNSGGADEAPVIQESNYLFLKQRYPNLIFHPDFERFDDAALLLLPLVDGVITSFSPVAWAAALCAKPVFSPISSEFSSICVQGTLSEVGRLPAAISIDQAERLFAYLFRYSDFSAEKTFYQPNWLSERLEAIVQLKRQGADKWAWMRAFSFTDSAYRDSFFQDSRDDGLDRSMNAALALAETGFPIALHRLEVCRKAVSLMADDRIQLVSFDIFDTLIERKTETPAHIFELMTASVSEITQGKITSFRLLRTFAEQQARRLAHEQGRAEIVLADIYRVLAEVAALNDEEIKRIIALELETERKMLFIREAGIRLLNAAKSAGKRVILVSDMYHSAACVESWLHSMGITGYDKLYLSSELGVRKVNGDLFRQVLVLENVSAEAWLHIGDNMTADIEQAKDNGLQTYHLQSAEDQLYQSKDLAFLYRSTKLKRTQWDAMYLGLVASRFYSDPALPVNADSHFNGSRFQLGYSGLGPLLTAFVIWLARQARRDGKKHLFFLSRDGFIMKQVFDVLQPVIAPDIETHYLYGSRAALRRCRISTVEDILTIASTSVSSCDFSVFLWERFSVSEERLTEAERQFFGQPFDTLTVSQDTLHRFLPFLFKIRETIFAISQENTEKYVAYLAQTGFTQCADKAVVDTGYMGTMQAALIRLLDDSSIGGYYLATLYDAARMALKGVHTRAFFGDFMEVSTFRSTGIASAAFETLVSNCEGSVWGIEKDAKGRCHPILDWSGFDLNRVRILSSIHAGAITFARDVVQYYAQTLDTIEFDPRCSVKMLGHFFAEPHPSDAQLLSGLLFEDFFGGRHQAVYVVPKKPEIVEEVNIEDRVQEALWKQGTEALLRDRKFPRVPTQEQFFGLRSTLKNQKDKLQQQAEAFEQLQAEYQKITQHLPKQDALLKERTNQLVESTRKLAEHKDYDTFKTAFYEQKELLKNRTETLIQHTEALKTAHRREKQLEADIAQKEKQYQQLVQEVQKWKNNYEDQKTQIEKWRFHCDELRDTVQKRQEYADRLKAQLDENKRLLSENRALLQTKTQALLQVNQQLKQREQVENSMKNIIALKDKKIEALKIELEKLQKRYDNLEKVQTEQRDLLKTRTENLVEHQNQIKEMQRTEEALKNVIGLKDKKVEAMRSDLEKLQSKYDNLEKVQTEQRELLKTRTEKIIELQNQIREKERYEQGMKNVISLKDRRIAEVIASSGKAIEKEQGKYNNLERVQKEQRELLKQRTEKIIELQNQLKLKERFEQGLQNIVALKDKKMASIRSELAKEQSKYNNLKRVQEEQRELLKVRTTRLVNAEKEVRQKQRLEQTLKNIIIHKNQMIDGKNKQMQAKQTAYDNLKELLKTRTDDLVDKTRTLRAQNRTLKSLKSTLESRTEQNTKLKDTLERQKERTSEAKERLKIQQNKPILKIIAGRIKNKFQKRENA